MGDEVREEEEWLYGGEENGDTAAPTINEAGKDVEAGDSEEGAAAKVIQPDEEAKDAEPNDKEQPMDDGEGESEEEDEDDSDDDGVQVVIGDIKSTGAGGQSVFGAVVAGVKRPAPGPDKKGKFQVEDFETPGTVNGMSAIEFNIDGLEDKPWRKPGADITDYFNYGFTEETWRAYTERQKRMRFESGGPQIINPIGPKPMDNRGVITVAFSGQNQGPMQNQRMDMMMMNRRREEPKENSIQVMTADRREYSRKNFEMGMGGPPMPPTFNPTIPPPNFPPPGHGGPPPGPEFMNPEFFNHPPPQYYPEDQQGYEEQWMDHHTDAWDMGMAGGPPQGSAIVSLTKSSNVPPPPGDEPKHERKD